MFNHMDVGLQGTMQVFVFCFCFCFVLFCFVFFFFEREHWSRCALFYTMKNMSKEVDRFNNIYNAGIYHSWL